MFDTERTQNRQEAARDGNAGGNARESGIMMVCVLDVGGKCLQNVHQSDKMMGHG